MKKIYLGIALVAASMLTTACGDDFLKLTPLDAVTQETFYTNQSDVEKAVNGVYAAMINGGTANGFDILNYTLMSEVRSNNYDAVAFNAAADWYDIGNFIETSSTDALELNWQYAYKLIYSANELLSKIDGISFKDASLKERYRAEVRFLRAYAHFELVRMFGRVPLVDHVLSVSEAKKLKLSSVEQLYDFIVSELEATVDPLPVSYTSANLGRVTKWTAHAMLGRVLLTRAGYPLKETQYLVAAREHLKAVIDQEGVNVKWCANYADLFTLANENKYNLFELQHVSGGISAGTFLPCYIGPSFGKTDPRYQAQGSILYSSSSCAVSDDLIAAYAPEDKRKEVTLAQTYINSEGVVANSNYFVKFREKGCAAWNLTSRYDWPGNFPVLRYEDVVLMYAEILNIEGKTVEAVPYLNKTRIRAGLEALPLTLSQDEFWVELKKERRLEFAGEGILWYDLVRWDDAVNVMNDWFAVKGSATTISRENYTYTLPLSQILVVGEGVYE